MLINLSNHHSSKWSQEQLDAAQKYGTIVNFQFPNIEPTTTSSQVSKLAEDYFNAIVDCTLHSREKEITVHVMGEMTFVYALVSMIHNRNIPDMTITAIASTTERISQENPDGTKTVRFNFCQFREYPYMG